MKVMLEIFATQHLKILQRQWKESWRDCFSLAIINFAVTTLLGEVIILLQYYDYFTVY